MAGEVAGAQSGEYIQDRSLLQQSERRYGPITIGTKVAAEMDVAAETTSVMGLKRSSASEIPLFKHT